MNVGSPSWAGVERVGSKILAHEAFHILQYELAGEYALDGGLDDVPRIGPQWLLEGGAEYVAYRAVSRAGFISMADITAFWAQNTKPLTATLQSCETSRGLFGSGAPYQIAPLAVQLLVGSQPDAVLAGYLEAVRAGVAWPTAFAAAFGRTVEAFYAEFAAYRAGL